MNADKDDSWAHQYLADREYDYCLGKDRRKFEGETSLFEKEKDDPEANKECALTRKKWASALVQFNSVQFSSVAHSCLTLCDPMNRSMPGLPVHHQLPEFTQTHGIELVMPSNHHILCRPLLLPSIFPSIRVFSNESALHMRWPKYWSSSFNFSPSNEHLGLISFRMDWLDLLAVQETLRSLLQHHSSKASILWCSAFFIVQLSHPYMTTGKTIALTRRTFVDKVMFLVFNMLSRLVITFLSRSKCLLISWLQSPSAVILEPPKIKSSTASTVSPSICLEVMGPDAMILVSECWDLSQLFHSPLSRGSLVLLHCVP